MKMKNFQYLKAALLRKLLVLLSLPVIITSCKTSDNRLVEPDPILRDSTVVVPVDTIKPNYYNPEIQTDYGVIQITPQYDSARPVTLYGVKVPIIPKQ